MKFRIDRTYLALACLIFIIEAIIARYVHDGLIRPFAGDVLVVILIYCFIRSLFDIPVLAAASATLAFSFLIEFLQSQNLVARLGWERSAIARAVLGTSFSWIDIAMYIGGVCIVLMVEFNRRKSRGDRI
jgi:hypothetical protein